MLIIKNLKKRFNLEAGIFAKYGRFIYAVNDISFEIKDGQTYGLVGESGCGKSTTAKLLVKMYDSDEGQILFNSTNVNHLKGKALKEYREKVKYIFQDPVKSLNPRMNIYDILTSGYRWSKQWPGKILAKKEAEDILIEVGLSAEDLYKYPSEFSGGQRQRISIARALLMKPEVLICDEVVSALDVSIQGQILNLIQDIREKRNISILFIAHDLKISCYFCDKIGVMYRGVLMEEAVAKNLYTTALHPYTKLLFASVDNSDNTKKSIITGEVKTQTNTLSGCPFQDRCPNCIEKCKNNLPPLKSIVHNDEEHKIRCWLFE